MLVALAKKGRGSNPTTSRRWIHDLKKSPSMAPNHDEVGLSSRSPGDDDRRKASGGVQDQVVFWDQDLFDVESKGLRDVLQDIDRTAVEVGLAALAEPGVVARESVADKKSVERDRAAVHGGNLDRLRDDAAAPRGSDDRHVRTHDER
jgi:hypothetical protein